MRRTLFIFLAILFIAIPPLGRGQYRNAVASGQATHATLSDIFIRIDPTLPRYGTDCVQQRFLTPAQKTKPWTEWTEKEAAKVLNDSAWGQTQTEVAEAAPTSVSAVTPTTAARREDQRISAASNTESGEGKTRASINYRVRFLSAKPVRAAFVRMIELQGATPERVAELRPFVDRDFGDYIVIALSIDGTDQKRLGPSTEAIKTAEEAALQKSAYLERKDGSRVFLTNFRAPVQDGLGAKFVFPRVVDGKPFIDSNSGEFKFVLEIGKTIKLNRKFKVADMMYEGKLEY